MEISEIWPKALHIQEKSGKLQTTKALNSNSFWVVQYSYLPWNSLHKKWSFPLRISSGNVTKSAVSSGFGHIYYRNPYWKTSFLCSDWSSKSWTKYLEQSKEMQENWLREKMQKNLLLRIFDFCCQSLTFDWKTRY